MIHNLNPSEVIMVFGPDKGSAVADLPRKSIEYWLEQDWVEEEYPVIHEAMEYELAIRDRSYDSY